MYEFRWLAIRNSQWPTMPILQYRTKIETFLIPEIKTYGWSDWQDVPFVLDNSEEI
jgi:hypothetical protein